ncbi:FadR/GntR family transcriptional regulator, partial [Sinorhizobium sojae]
MALENITVRKSLADLVFERMHRAIKSGAYQSDERLPTEHDLAAEFEVSRPVIREALRRLREQGLIYSRRGAGSFVRVLGMKEPLGFGQLENVADLLNCYEFRLTLEPAAAAAAAAR